MKTFFILITLLLIISPKTSFAGECSNGLLLFAPGTAFSDYTPPESCYSYQYTEWSDCSESGYKTRELLECFPDNCIRSGENYIAPITSMECTPTCNDVVYSNWGDCINGQQERIVEYYTPHGCSGNEENVYLKTTKTCTACTGRIYSNWGDCINGQQERVILQSTPSGCIGEPETPVILKQSCGNDLLEHNYNSNQENDSNIKEDEIQIKDKVEDIIEDIVGTEFPIQNKCSYGYIFFNNHCVNIPDNAHGANNGVDAWLCNDGYEESGNYCIKKIIEEISENNVFIIETTTDEIIEGATNPVTPEVKEEVKEIKKEKPKKQNVVIKFFQNIFKSIGSWFR